MVMLLHVWPNAIPVKNISAPLQGAPVRILILSDFASAMIADKLLVTTTITLPSWPEAVQWSVLASFSCHNHSSLIPVPCLSQRA